MNYEETSELLDYISSCYQMNVQPSMLYAWADILQLYDYDEVKQALDEAMAEERFQRTPPQAQYLVRNLMKKYDKVDYTKQVIYCSICRRPLNQPDYEKHFNRCSSAEYVICESKKWFNQNLNKKDLFEMSDSEFEERYNKLLKYIKEHTTDAEERLRIEFIFNPPANEKAKKFLSKGI